MNEILFICGYIPNDNDIKNNSINFMNVASNVFSKQFIDGFKQNGEKVIVISAPFIGGFPINYRKAYFSGKKYDDEYNYVSFINIWGIRNIFRYISLKQYIRKKNLYKINKIVIYSVHTPFAKLAKYIKKKNKNCKICLITPDLPEYMNLREKKSIIYRLFKKYDCRLFYSRIKYFDFFSLVTKYQSIKVNYLNKPEVVIEAIADECSINKKIQSNNNKNKIKKIVYTGTLNKKFGIINLLEAFVLIEEKAELIICGGGDAKKEVELYANNYNNITYLGELRHDEVIIIQNQADILVNPRKNNEEYTKYSFPSKTLEYMRTGKPIICYKLDGIPDEYDKYLIYPNSDDIYSLAKTIESVIHYDEEKLISIQESICDFLKEKSKQKATKKILKLFYDVTG